jgi:hypothetical protein
VSPTSTYSASWSALEDRRIQVRHIFNPTPIVSAVKAEELGKHSTYTVWNNLLRVETLFHVLLKRATAAQDILRRFSYGVERL